MTSRPFTATSNNLPMPGITNTFSSTMVAGKQVTQL